MARSLHELSFNKQVTVFGALSVLVVAAAWQTILAPARADLATREAGLSGVQAEVAKVSAVARQLPVYQKEVAALEQALVSTTAVLPNEKDAQEVLRQLHTLASEASLDISSFTPKPVAAKAMYSEWPIDLGLEGSYHDLGRFFDRVAGLPLLISVSELHIKARPAPGGRGSLIATCLATTFVFRKPGGKS